MNFIEKKAAREFEEGDVIFHEKDEGSSMFIIQTGEVEVSAIKNNKKVVFARLTNGAIFGEMALIDGHPRSATVTALKRTTCVEMSRMLFQKHLEALPPWMRSFFQIMAERLREANKRADTMTTRDNSRQIVLMVSNILMGHEPNKQDEIVVPWKPMAKDISVLLNLPYDQVDKVLNKMSLSEMARSELRPDLGRVFIMKDFHQFKFFADYCKSRFLLKEGSDIPEQFKKISEKERELIEFLHLIMREQRWEPEVEHHLFEARFEEELGRPLQEFEREMKSLRLKEVMVSKLDGDDRKTYLVDKEKLRGMLSVEETLIHFEEMDQKL